MLRISVTNDAADHWEPVISRHFAMTLAPLGSSIRSLSVHLLAPDPGDGSGIYECEIQGRSAKGSEVQVSSIHEQGNVAIAHAFARARRELARGRLRGVRG